MLRLYLDIQPKMRVIYRLDQSAVYEPRQTKRPSVTKEVMLS